MQKGKAAFNFKSAAAVAMGLLVSGCMGTKLVAEQPATGELSPMVKPTVMAKQRIYQKNNLSGEEEFIDITEVRDDGTIAAKNSLGCGWESHPDLVAPPYSWSKCNDDPKWHSGKNTILDKDGEIWPLAVGNKVVYTFEQFNADGESSGKRKRKCTVENVVNITVNEEATDAFKVVCIRRQDSWSRTQVFYFNPAAGREVKYVNSSSSKGVETNKDTLRVEQI